MENGIVMNRAIFALAFLAVSSATALADMNAAKSCGAGLSGNAKIIFDNAAATFRPGDEVADIIRGEARKLVLSGKMTRDVAKPAAMAAGECLKLAKQ